MGAVERFTHRRELVDFLQAHLPETLQEGTAGHRLASVSVQCMNFTERRGTYGRQTDLAAVCQGVIDTVSDADSHHLRFNMIAGSRFIRIEATPGGDLVSISPL